MMIFGILVLGIILGGGITYLLLKNTLSSQDPGVPIVPAGVITPTEARELDENWTMFRKTANDTAAGKPDNRSSWYSLAAMENYIALTKSEQEKTNGFRLYLGVKTTETDEKGYTTIFIVPTENDSGVNKDIAAAQVLDRGEGGMPPNISYPN